MDARSSGRSTGGARLQKSDQHLRHHGKREAERGQGDPLGRNIERSEQKTGWCGKTKRSANRAAQALRLAAAALRTSRSALGAYFRRLCARVDKPKAVSAAAHKLARLIYTMPTKGEEYTDQGQDNYEERYRQRVLHHLSQRAAKLGMKVIANERPA